MTELQTTWGWMLAVDLFLGGLGAGVLCTVAITSLVARERFRATVRFGAWASAIAIAVGTLFLLLDVGRPFRALVLFRSFVHEHSWMTYGAWLMFSALLLNGLLALLWTDQVLTWLELRWRPFHKRMTLWRTILAAIAIPVNLGVAIYTGILIGVLRFRPLWHTWLLPVLFATSAFCTGLGVVAVYAARREVDEGSRRFRMTLQSLALGLLALTGLAAGVFLANALRRSPEAASSARMLINGALSPAFWIGVVSAGLALPFLAWLAELLGVLRRNKTAALVVPLVGLVCLLIGGWMLRFVVLSAGQPQMLVSPALDDIMLLGGVKFVP